MLTKLERSQNRINERQSELQRVADVLAKEAFRLRSRGAFLRVCLIILGALTATQGSFEQLGFFPKQYLSFIFLILGILITAIAGIEAAFKFESRGADLNSLAASCHSMVRQADSIWHKQVGAEEDSSKQAIGALQVIEFQELKLNEVQEKAASTGVNIALEIRRVHNKSLRTSDDDDDDDDDNRQRPYMA